MKVLIGAAALLIVILPSALNASSWRWPVFKQMIDGEQSVLACALANEYEYEDFLSANRPWSYQVNSDPAFVRYGSDSLRFELRPGDCGGTDCAREPPGERTELAQVGDSRSREGEEVWWGLSLYVPDDFVDAGAVPLSSFGTTFFQFQQCCLFDPAFMFVKHHGDAFKVSSFRTLWRTHPFQEIELISDADFRGRWHDFVIHTKWTVNDDGFLRVWVNGVLKANYTGQTRSEGNEFVYHKLGLYRSSHSSDPPRQWAYFDEIRRGERRECVDILGAIEP